MEERLGRMLAMTGKVVRAQFDQDLGAVGSSLNTYVILRTVATTVGLSQRELAAALGIESPTLTRHLDRLAAEGLLVRDRSLGDRRVSQVRLTAAGQAHLDQVESHAAQFDQQLRSLFTPDEAATLAELLTRIRGRYKKEADVNAAP